MILGLGRWDGRRNRPVPDAVWLEQHRRALPFVLKRESERGGAATPRLVSNNFRNNFNLFGLEF